MATARVVLRLLFPLQDSKAGHRNDIRAKAPAEMLCIPNHPDNGEGTGFRRIVVISNRRIFIHEYIYG